MSESLVHHSGLSLRIQGNICSLSFGSSKNKNALSFEQAEFLGRLCARTAHSPSELQQFLSDTQAALLVVKSGLDDIFLSGGDLREISSFDTAQGAVYTAHMRTFCAELRMINVPSLCLLAAPAYGGGTEVALATDFRWSTNHRAALHFWQTRWGVPGGWNGMVRLQEIVPQWDGRKVALLFACQKSLLYPDLVRLGIVDEDLSGEPSDEVESRLQALADRFAECPAALRSELLGRPGLTCASRAAALQADEQIFARHWLGAEHLRRVAQFSKKGTP